MDQRPRARPDLAATGVCRNDAAYWVDLKVVAAMASGSPASGIVMMATVASADCSAVVGHGQRHREAGAAPFRGACTARLHRGAPPPASPTPVPNRRCHDALRRARRGGRRGPRPEHPDRDPAPSALHRRRPLIVPRRRVTPARSERRCLADCEPVCAEAAHIALSDIEDFLTPKASRSPPSASCRRVRRRSARSRARSSRGLNGFGR